MIVITINGSGGNKDFSQPMKTVDFSSVNKDFEAAKFDEVTYSGLPTLTTLAFEYLDNGQPKRIELNEVILTVTASKNINRISMLGRDFDIIEYVSKSNYEIEAAVTVMEKMVGDDSDYPLEKMRELIKMLDAPATISVQSDFLELWCIRSVVVTGHSVSQTTWANNQPMSISMISDEPYEIKTKKDAIS